MGLKSHFKKIKTNIERQNKERQIYITSIYVYLLQNIFNIKRIKTDINNKLSFSEILMYFTPNWYHDFSCLGIKTFQFEEEGAKYAQEDKQYIIFEQIKKAIDHINDTNNSAVISGIELFCADGFYSNYAIQNGVTKMTGIDLEEESGEGNKRNSVLDQGRLAAKLLNNEDKTEFLKENVYNLEQQYDLCLCLGGLYHIDNPESLLLLLRKYITKALVIQTVVSLETEDDNYFETPCPDWTWGCRFSHNYLKQLVYKTGWKIIDESRNEITWNKRLCDKGSSYLVCIPDENAGENI